MTTKIQKIFAKFIRTKNPHERKVFKRKLKGVKVSEVSYTKGGKKYTIHGDIPWEDPNSRKPKKGRKPVQHSDPGTGPRRKGWRPLKTTPKPRKVTREEFARWESDNEARAYIKWRNKKR